jgi:3-oxoacyl-[acyl-carrier-protein] synthase-3
MQQNLNPETSGLCAAMLGSGRYLPDRIITNRYFTEVMGLDTSEEWILSKTGIRERRFAPPEIEVVDMATSAGRIALKRSGVHPHEIGMIIVATSTHHLRMPSAACLVQAALGANHAAAFDINNACAAFVTATDVATRYTHQSKRPSLVIGADCGGRVVDPKDRLTSIFFGDGAGAVVYGHTDRPHMLASHIISRGETAALSIPCAGFMSMNGQAIWNFATKEIPDLLINLCEQAGVLPCDIDHVIPHQANHRMIECIAERAGIPLDRFVVEVDQVGNMMAASIPSALAGINERKPFKSGDLVAMVGFGAGLAWGGQIFRQL